MSLSCISLAFLRQRPVMAGPVGSSEAPVFFASRSSLPRKSWSDDELLLGEGMSRRGSSASLFLCLGLAIFDICMQRRQYCKGESTHIDSYLELHINTSTGRSEVAHYSAFGSESRARETAPSITPCWAKDKKHPCARRAVAPFGR